MLERGRWKGLLLAGLLVASVFAAATPASAGLVSATRGTDASVEAGATTTVTVTATMDASGGSFTLYDTFGGKVDGATIRQVTVDGTPVTPDTADANATFALVALVDTGPNAVVEVTYELEASNETGTVLVEGSVSSGSAEVDLGTDTIDVTSAGPSFDVSGLSSVGTVSAGDTATVSATVTNTGSTSATRSVDLRVGSGVSASQSVTLADGASRTVDFTLDTSGLSAGTYTYAVATADASASSTFEVTGGCGFPSALAESYDRNGNCGIELRELGTASRDFANGEISLTQLGQVSRAFANS